jgi:hypothetical protein
MDAAPRLFAELPRDPVLGVPVPFACGTSAYPAGPDGSGPSVEALDGRRVTQCALSRVCGVCGAGLGRPLAFLGSPEEEDRTAFHFPACHLECALGMREALSDLVTPVLGQPDQVDVWALVTAPAFEFVRPGGDDADPRPTFQPVQARSTSTSAGRGPE